MERLQKLLLAPVKILSRGIPSRLLQSNIAVDKKYLERISREHKIERDWYEKVPSFPTNSDIIDAANKGVLVKVVETPDYLPIMRLRNPKLHDEYPPYLTKASAALLGQITAEWRKRMLAEGFDKNVRLAVTSLTRSQEYQDQIVASGKMALSDGPHLRGEAFDIDGCGYYVGDKPVNPRQKKVGGEFHKAFEQMDAGLPEPELIDYSEYQPRIHEILHEVLNDLMAKNKLHYLHEFPNTNNTVFHVARNPNAS
ncbi:hypothetical protein EPO04_00055 [Patescibacteria group bacterium]|nr:MAG: hypothetical protein EPO04_00055 [Patescibacteria group bacterium]